MVPSIAGACFGERALPVRAAVVALALISAITAARAQTGNNGDATPAPPATEATPKTPAPADAKAQQLAPVQITGSRPDDVQERRNATAAKIVIGRDEIDRFGDSTLGDVLKRLPGVTLQGRPGRGGAIAMRGLGNGYTQILLDGERVPPGFSLDSLTPDQIERIEILRAPTAETGARAIAGTINIVTRGGYSKRVNDVRVTAGYENGSVQPSVSWTRNLTAGPFIVNYSLSAFHYSRDNSSSTTTVDRRQGDGTVSLEQIDDGRARVRGGGVHATARIQWRPEGSADSATLTPIVVWNRFRFHRDGTLGQTVGAAPPPYDSSATDGRNGSMLMRLNGEWTHRLDGGGRAEWRAGLGQTRSPAQSFRRETTGGALSRTFDDSSDSRETSFTSTAKLVRTIVDEHSLVAGVELESNRRSDDDNAVQTVGSAVTPLINHLSASSLRLAAYAQDEWNLTPQWAAHAGLRWEGIRTEGSAADGQPDASNRSSVWSPLLHAVWKPDAKSRDQVRVSLTRSYRSPTLTNLIARPYYNTRYPVDGANTPTQPDRIGNPDLKPELATGVDIAIERYLPGSGLLSANVFRRDISNYMRGETHLETVPYSPVPRYVLRTRNVGSAVTQGLELEAKFRASEVWPGAPKVDLRANASVFGSRVKGVPGPDNRLDAQPDYTANVGADYRFAAVPMTIGGNLNWTPGYATRLSAVQTASIGRKLVVDAYALWVFNPALQVRLTLSNLDARDYVFASAVDGPNAQGVPVRETSQTTQPTYVNVQLRLEMKL